LPLPSLSVTSGDGKPDLVVANCGSTLKQFSCPNDESDGVVAVFLGNGDGTFQTPTTYDSAGGQAVSIALSDVNLDGKMDVLVGNGCADSSCTSAGGVGVLLGNGDGTLKAAVAYSGVGQGSVAVADINGDGKPDLILGGFQIGVMLGNGDGTFQFSAFYTVGISSAVVVVADVNRDGKPDVIAAETCGNGNCTYGVISVLLGNGDATFQAAVP
jgi:FG-GAP-like repeat